MISEGVRGKCAESREQGKVAERRERLRANGRSPEPKSTFWIDSDYTCANENVPW
jgi:hypothetical protein